MQDKMHFLKQSCHFFPPGFTSLWVLPLNFVTRVGLILSGPHRQCNAVQGDLLSKFTFPEKPGYQSLLIYKHWNVLVYKSCNILKMFRGYNRIFQGIAQSFSASVIIICVKLNKRCWWFTATSVHFRNFQLETV